MTRFVYEHTKDTYRDFQNYLSVVGVILQKYRARGNKFQLTPSPATSWENMRQRFSLVPLHSPQVFSHPGLNFSKD